MYNFYEYVYYMIYKFQLKLWGDSDISMHTAMLGIVAIQFLSGFIIITICELIFELHILDYEHTIIMKISIVIIAIILMIINSKFYKGNEKLIKIKNKLKNISKSEKIRLTIFMWLNLGLIISYFLFFFVKSFLNLMKG